MSQSGPSEELVCKPSLFKELFVMKSRREGDLLVHENPAVVWSTFVKVSLTIMLFLAVFMQHFFTFALLRDQPLYLSTLWSTSVVYILIFRISARHLSSFNCDGDLKSNIVRHIPLLIVYIVTVYIKETNLASQVTTQGPSALLVNLCLSPLIVTAALTCLTEEQPASWVSALTVTYSGMMLMTVCSDNGSCFVSLKDAAFNVVFTAFYGIYFIKIAQSLCEFSVVQALLLLNTVSVLVIPLLVIFSREGDIIWNDPSALVTYLDPAVIVPVILLRLFEMITTLLHIKVTGVTTHVMTRNLAWIPLCLAIALILKIDLMVSSFKAIWIVSSSYILYVIYDDSEAKKPS